MTNFLTSVLRTFAQTAVGYLVTYLAALGLDVPQQVRDWAGGAIFAAGILLWTALVRWLETRKGTGAVATACRKLARILMLGIGSRPVYVPDGGAVQGTTDAAGTHSVPISAPVPGDPAAGRHAAPQYATGRADPTQVTTTLGGLPPEIDEQVRQRLGRDAGTVL